MINFVHGFISEGLNLSILTKTMKFIRIITTFGLILTHNAHSQIIDHFGLRIGAGLSNQYWDYKRFPSLSEWKKDKIGLAFYINAEKKLNKYLSVRPEIGYIQKGFTEDINLTSETGEDIGILDNDIILHDLSLNIAVKFSPLKSKFKPYIIAGFQGNYLLGYQDLQIEFNGIKQGLYKSILDSLQKFTFGGLIGIGIEYNNLIYLDIEYNPALTKNLDRTGLSIKDRYFGLTLGLNINVLLKENKE
jgi:hypothetical protein